MLWMRRALGLSCILNGVLAAFSANEDPYQRSYAYFGGQYVDDGSGQHVFTNQMYVERLTPVGVALKPHPIVFIHGQAQTGTV